jgi:hypothetical protein
LFSLTTILSAPSHPLAPLFTSPFHLPPTCHHTTPPSYTLTMHWLACCKNCTQSQTLAIPDTSTLHYNNRNTPNTHKGQKTSSLHSSSTTHTPLFPPTPLFSATFTNSPKSITSLITITAPNSHCL